jgi:AraC-like DNA-binding protein
MDVLETALSRFRFSKLLYCAHCTNRAPWGVGIAAGHGLQIHAVRSGHAWIRVQGEQPVELETGDFVMVPHGTAHDVIDAPDTPATPVGEQIAAQRPTSPWLLGFGTSGGAVTEMVCAGFACAADCNDPLISFLPKVVHLRAAETASLEPILRLSERELRAGSPATEAVLLRLAEILVVEAVRSYVKTLGPGQCGWLGALHDPQISRVLLAIHEAPARRWTLAGLASLASMSRTSLATRFRALVGTSVHAYIARLRMLAAASLLEDPKRPKLARVAAEVGYGSEAAFSRAFLREMGYAPTKLRPRVSAKSASGRSA